MRRLRCNEDAEQTWAIEKENPHQSTYLEAHISIADDSIPLILTGFKLQRKTPNLPSSCSMGNNPAKPLTTVLGEASPRSTVSTYRLSVKMID